MKFHCRLWMLVDSTLNLIWKGPMKRSHKGKGVTVRLSEEVVAGGNEIEVGGITYDAET